jgi:ubiquinone/menaquinone biosynthesis C-methylase UbiE
MDTALDIGCGTGAFSRLLSERASRVIAIDLSPTMIEIARQRSVDYPNIEFAVADALTYRYGASTYDCVASIAALHHLPMERMLSSIRQSLRPGGVLAILDLYQAQSAADWLYGALGAVAAPILRLYRGGAFTRTPNNVRQAWAAHGQHDRYPSLTGVRAVCSRALPGAHVRRHVLWRYSILWTKPASG